MFDGRREGAGARLEGKGFFAFVCVHRKRALLGRMVGVGHRNIALLSQDRRPATAGGVKARDQCRVRIAAEIEHHARVGLHAIVGVDPALGRHRHRLAAVDIAREGDRIAAHIHQGAAGQVFV